QAGKEDCQKCLPCPGLRILLSFWVAVSPALYFHSGEREEKCIIEDIPSDTLITGRFLESAPGLGMFVTITTPTKELLLSKLYGPQGTFSFTSHLPGEHNICLQSNSTKLLSFGGSKLRIHLDIRVGEHFLDEAIAQAKDKVNEVNFRLGHLIEQIHHISKEQNYHRGRLWLFCRPRQKSRRPPLSPCWALAAGAPAGNAECRALPRPDERGRGEGGSMPRSPPAGGAGPRGRRRHAPLSPGWRSGRGEGGGMPCSPLPEEHCGEGGSMPRSPPAGGAPRGGWWHAPLSPGRRSARGEGGGMPCSLPGGGAAGGAACQPATPPTSACRPRNALAALVPGATPANCGE
uniref:GOLD domain-containing protein n=1 Tax=Chelydra serpentina TaxID=8475 RepID=A0A8C3XPS5_CHESE